jgi:hypothetical protein
MVDFLILGSALSVLVGTLELINLIFTVVAVFKIRKLKLSNMTKLFPIFVILLTLFIIILTVIFAGGAYELASNGSSIQKAVLATPYWILILDQVTYFIFMIWAINIFWKLKRIY